MSRAPTKLPDGKEWVGQRVMLTRGPINKVGVVQRMAVGKELCMMVQFDGQAFAYVCYARELTKLPPRLGEVK